MATLPAASDSHSSMRHYPSWRCHGRVATTLGRCFSGQRLADQYAQHQLGVPTKLTSQPPSSLLLVLRIPTRSGWNGI